jgi:hypothetical protein
MKVYLFSAAYSTLHPQTFATLFWFICYFIFLQFCDIATLAITRGNWTNLATGHRGKLENLLYFGDLLEPII